MAIRPMTGLENVPEFRNSWINRKLVAGAFIVAITCGTIAATIFLLGAGGRSPASYERVGADRLASSGRQAPVPLPVVETLAWKPLAQDDARAINAAVPFSSEPNPPAAPFRMAAEGPAFERALDCLAAAVFYEAGDDVIGQQAVAQVVLNRVRHPAFTPSVCSVVFHGSERTTGCQFTFTCDGAMQRYRPTPQAWERARAVARLALTGFVYRPVGHATHYHTDWVVPYWSARLDKIAAVGTHLFFRWDGWWGTPRAFSVRPAAAEGIVGMMAGLSPAHGAGDLLALQPESAGGAGRAPLPDITADCGAQCAPDTGFDARLAGADSDIFFVRIGLQADATRFPALAAQACGSRTRCIVMGWRDAHLIPPGLPASTTQLQSMDFHYLRDPLIAEPRYRWNCARFTIGRPANCLSHQRLGNVTEPQRTTVAGVIALTPS